MHASANFKGRAFGILTGVANNDTTSVFDKGSQCFREKIRSMKGEKNGEICFSKRSTTPNVPPGLQACHRGMERDVCFTPHKIYL